MQDPAKFNQHPDAALLSPLRLYGERHHGRFRMAVRVLAWLFSSSFLIGVASFFVFVAVIDFFARAVPDTSELEKYVPPTVSRVYSGDGMILDEFAYEKRLYTPASEIPDLVKHAFISAEDKNFYIHEGYDVRGMVGAILEAIRGGRHRGASTIPQQVAKNFVLSDEKTISRKVTEVIIANKLVRTIDRDHILGLYLNEIFLGQNSYGVTAAAQTFFSKRLEELTTEEVAYLAAVPKAPSKYHPVENYDRAYARRNFVLKEMFENGYIDHKEYMRAKVQPIRTVQSGDLRARGRRMPPRDYFTDEIRRQLSAEFGPEQLFAEGLSVRATIDQKLQERARFALRRALEAYDRQQQIYNGPIGKIVPALLKDGWSEVLSETRVPRDIAGWYPAVVLEPGETEARIGVEGFGEASISLGDVRWAKYRDENGERRTAKSTDDMFDRGDIIYVKETGRGWSFRQIPAISGGFTAMDPRNGRVLALVGGFSYEYSNYNRATQAQRQPGSAFKPFVYAAALDAGYKPNAIIVDAPLEVKTIHGVWKPQNASRIFYGPTPMMTGLEQSRNLMTVRLAQDVGIEKVAKYGERFGIYDRMQPVLANSLGSQETSLYKIVAAFSTFANGGRAVKPSVVDRVQDRFGKTIYAHDGRECIECAGDDSAPDKLPQLLSKQEQVMDPITAYQITLMLQSAVRSGTGRKTVGRLGLPIAGKTGTTNQAKDVWFVGYTPKIVAGCFIGYDHPTPLGEDVSGGGMCGPVFVNFMTEALKNYGGFEREVPEGGYYVKLDRASGVRLPNEARGPGVIAMYFRDSTIPAVGEVGKFIDGGFTIGTDVVVAKKSSVPGASSNSALPAPKPKTITKKQKLPSESAGAGNDNAKPAKKPAKPAKKAAPAPAPKPVKKAAPAPKPAKKAAPAPAPKPAKKAAPAPKPKPAKKAAPAPAPKPAPKPAKKPAEVKVEVKGKTKALPKNTNVDSISSGGLY